MWGLRDTGYWWIYWNSGCPIQAVPGKWSSTNGILVWHSHVPGIPQWWRHENRHGSEGYIMVHQTCYNMFKATFPHHIRPPVKETVTENRAALIALALWWLIGGLESFNRVVTKVKRWKQCLHPANLAWNLHFAFFILFRWYEKNVKTICCGDVAQTTLEGKDLGKLKRRISLTNFQLSSAAGGEIEVKEDFEELLLAVKQKASTWGFHFDPYCGNDLTMIDSWSALRGHLQNLPKSNVV